MFMISHNIRSNLLITYINKHNIWTVLFSWLGMSFSKKVSEGKSESISFTKTQMPLYKRSTKNYIAIICYEF